MGAGIAALGLIGSAILGGVNAERQADAQKEAAREAERQQRELQNLQAAQTPESQTTQASRNVTERRRRGVRATMVAHRGSPVIGSTTLG